MEEAYEDGTQLWWLVTYDPTTETASRAIAVVGAEPGDRVLEWIGGRPAADVLDALTVEPPTPEGVAPMAVMCPARDVVLALIEVDRPPPGELHEAVRTLAAAATELVHQRRSP